MIEIVSPERCTGCNICVSACPTQVFEAVPDGIPRIARQSDCQTCFMCEAYCPTDALYVSPESTPVGDGFTAPEDLVGSYRERLGWGKGRRPGSLVAVGPEIPHGDPPPRRPERLRHP